MADETKPHEPQPGARYVVQGTLKHNSSPEADPDRPGRYRGEYKHGDDFHSNDPELLKELHRVGAIKLPSEVEDPEVVAARERGLQAELAALRAENARLKEAAGSRPKSGSARARNEAADAVASGESSGEDASAEAEDE